MNAPTKFEVRGFTRSRDNRGYPKNLDSPWIRSRFIVSEIFNGLLFGMAIHPPNLKSVALPVPEIRGGRLAKLQTPNLEEGEATGVGDGTIRKSIGQFLLTLHTYYSSISTRLPEILDCSFQWGLRTPDFGEGEAVGGRGWYRSKERW